MKSTWHQITYNGWYAIKTNQTKPNTHTHTHTHIYMYIYIYIYIYVDQTMFSCLDKSTREIRIMNSKPKACCLMNM